MNQDKSKSRVRDILKQKYHPDQWKAEQEQKEREIAEMLAFVDGIVKGLESQKESKILFKSNDPQAPWNKN